jgi:ubiquinone/menaquinone biosynthesis C-methylase UbiE
MIGDVEREKVLDIGCGEGCFSRFFARTDTSVVGVDLSDALIRAAAEEEQRQPLGVNYFAADAANLDMLESESFDVAFCYMALLDIRDYEGATSEASRVLMTGGRLVVLIEHPCFTQFRV